MQSLFDPPKLGQGLRQTGRAVAHLKHSHDANVGQPRAETVAKQPEQPEDNITVSARVSHDLRRLQLGLLLQDHRQQNQAVAQSAGQGDGVQAGELVGDQIVVSHSPPGTKVLGVVSGVDCPHGHHKTHAVGGGDFPATPGAGQGDLVLRGRQACVGGNQGVVPHIILVDPR